MISLTKQTLVAVAVFTFASQPAFGQRVIPLRVGSWNIEHLGDPGSRRGTGTKQLQKASDLAKYIQFAKVDLLLLQEITADESAPNGFPRMYRTNRVLNETFGLLNRASQGKAEWKHILFPKAISSDRSQWTGVAWNSSRLSALGAPFSIPVSHRRSSQDKQMWNRGAYAMKFRVGERLTDFVVIPLHLKANYSNKKYAKHRDEEISNLLAMRAQLAKRFPGEADFIVGGDTNILGKDEPAVARFAKQGFKDLNPSADTHTSRGSSPVDKLFVPTNQPEFRRSTVQVTRDFMQRERLSYGEFRRRFSDHWIIVMEVRIAVDDD